MSTKVKTQKEIKLIRGLAQKGSSFREISKKTGVSVHVISKIVNRQKGYEGDVFDGRSRWTGGKLRAPIFHSEIDRELLHLQKSNDGYSRVVIAGKRDLFHIHEAKKAFTLIGNSWPTEAVVHHIDGDKRNSQISNLTVFESHRAHKQHHDYMEKQTYKYLRDKGLLSDFYSMYPDAKLQSIAELLTTKQNK